MTDTDAAGTVNPGSSGDKTAALRKALEAIENTPRRRIVDVDLEQQLLPVRNKALGLLAVRARSEHELRQRLLQSGCEKSLIDRVISSLRDNGLIDDADFAREWVRQRHQLRGKSRAALDQELREKGIAEPLRDAALSAVDADDERAVAREVAAKRARSVREWVAPHTHEYDKELRRILGALARRGFSADISYPVAKEALNNRLEELEQ